MMTTDEQTIGQHIHTCLRYLAGMDEDHAQEHNDVGYNGVDSHFGHSLAERETLTLPMLRAGYRMLRKYRKQLERAGYLLPSPEAVEAYINEKMATPAPVIQPAQEPTIQQST